MIEDTIIAQATAAGKAGVAILRLSGPRAKNISLSLTQKEEFSPRKAVFAKIFDRAQQILDEGLLIYFPAPHSFTGEDVVELHIHGSPILADAIIALALEYGARLAQPGEFSQRAFLNNKMDLVQAEAIADLIAANSLRAARMAQRSLQGEFSRYIANLQEKIIQLRMFLEAAIDFSDEEIAFIQEHNVQEKLQDLLQSVQQSLALTRQGQIVREGIILVIAGRPNVGKSTLINQLARQDLAIVTDIAGTTRDILRAEILLDGLPIHILDTAGLHESADPVEQEGIRRAWQAIAQADAILLLQDLTSKQQDSWLENLPQNVPVIPVWNKMDCVDETKKKEMLQTNPSQQEVFYISAKLGDGLEALQNKIKEIAGYQPEEGLYMARRRHVDALENCLGSLQQAKRQLQEFFATELVAEDLRYAHLALQEITGEFAADDLLGRIFSSFCIGK